MLTSVTSLRDLQGEAEGPGIGGKGRKSHGRPSIQGLALMTQHHNLVSKSLAWLIFENSHTLTKTQLRDFTQWLQTDLGFESGSMT